MFTPEDERTGTSQQNMVHKGGYRGKKYRLVNKKDEYER